jgi:sugar/nucleoside kinase (ribokinase family)
VDERTVYAALKEVSAPSLDVTLGGSAWNAIFALSKMQLGLRLGYVGVAGRVRVPGISSLQQLEILGIDHTFVRRSDRHDCGICLSYVDGGERTLLTAPGANVELAELLEERFEDLGHYLARTKVVHVTSLLDPESPGRLLTLLRRVKQINPSTALTFDPGHSWASSPTPEVEGVLSLSDYLLVNTAEFAALHQANGAIERRHFAHAPPPDDGIQDATGAGDVFAAGLLAVIAGSRLQLELGASLGMRLARHKLRYVGAQGHAEFPAIAQSFIGTRAAKRYHRDMPQSFS